MRILVTDGMDAATVGRLRQAGHEVVERSYPPEELGVALRDFDAVIIRSTTKIKEEQINAVKGSRLKLIVRAGVGLDNISVRYAELSGIAVKNTPDASSNAVAEHAIALLFSCARSISVAGHTMREQRWEKKSYNHGFELSGKTLGVIGYGRIGRLVGEKAQALGMRVLSYVNQVKPANCECETMQFVSRDELLSRSDAIVLCAPGGGKPLVDEAAISKMKDGVVIVNVSRGSNLDEAALLSALNCGKVRAAGLDVWADEKNPNWALAAHPAVSCTPHIGAGTKEAQQRIADELVDIICRF